jgi:hypothetical protein
VTSGVAFFEEGKERGCVLFLHPGMTLLSSRGFWGDLLAAQDSCRSAVPAVVKGRQGPEGGTQCSCSYFLSQAAVPL